MAIDVVALGTWAMGLLPWAFGLLILILLDGISGGLEAWKLGIFTWEYFPDFLQTGVLFVWAWVVAEVLGVLPTFLGIQISGWEQSLADYGPKAVFAFIAVSKYVASIVKHVKTIYALQNPDPVV